MINKDLTNRIVYLKNNVLDYDNWNGCYGVVISDGLSSEFCEEDEVVIVPFVLRVKDIGTHSTLIVNKKDLMKKTRSAIEVEKLQKRI